MQYIGEKVGHKEQNYALTLCLLLLFQDGGPEKKQKNVDWIHTENL
jgi:hypothetical protein